MQEMPVGKSNEGLQKKGTATLAAMLMQAGKARNVSGKCHAASVMAFPCLPSFLPILSDHIATLTGDGISSAKNATDWTGVLIDTKETGSISEKTSSKPHRGLKAAPQTLGQGQLRQKSAMDLPSGWQERTSIDKTTGLNGADAGLETSVVFGTGADGSDVAVGVEKTAFVGLGMPALVLPQQCPVDLATESVPGAIPSKMQRSKSPAAGNGLPVNREGAVPVNERMIAAPEAERFYRTDLEEEVTLNKRVGNMPNLSPSGLLEILGNPEISTDPALDGKKQEGKDQPIGSFPIQAEQTVMSYSGNGAQEKVATDQQPPAAVNRRRPLELTAVLPGEQSGQTVAQKATMTVLKAPPVSSSVRTGPFEMKATVPQTDLPIQAEQTVMSYSGSGAQEKVAPDQQPPAAANWKRPLGLSAVLPGEQSGQAEAQKATMTVLKAPPVSLSVRTGPLETKATVPQTDLPIQAEQTVMSYSGSGAQEKVATDQQPPAAANRRQPLGLSAVLPGEQSGQAEAQKATITVLKAPPASLSVRTGPLETKATVPQKDIPIQAEEIGMSYSGSGAQEKVATDQQPPAAANRRRPLGLTAVLPGEQSGQAEAQKATMTVLKAPPVSSSVRTGPFETKATVPQTDIPIQAEEIGMSYSGSESQEKVATDQQPPAAADQQPPAAANRRQPLELTAVLPGEQSGQDEAQKATITVLKAPPASLSVRTGPFEMKATVPQKDLPMPGDIVGSGLRKPFVTWIGEDIGSKTDHAVAAQLPRVEQAGKEGAAAGATRGDLFRQLPGAAQENSDGENAAPRRMNRPDSPFLKHSENDAYTPNPTEQSLRGSSQRLPGAAVDGRTDTFRTVLPASADGKGEVKAAMSGSGDSIGTGDGRKERTSVLREKPGVRLSSPEAAGTDPFFSLPLKGYEAESPIRAPENIHAEDLMEQIRQARSLLQRDSGRIRITLNPPSLGALDMEIVVRQNKVEVIMRVDNILVQQVLQANAEELKANLQGQGLSFDGLSVLNGGTTDRQDYAFANRGALWQEGQGRAQTQPEADGNEGRIPEIPMTQPQQWNDTASGMISLFV